MAMMTKQSLQVKHGATPDESRPFASKGHAEVHQLSQGAVMKGVFEPGWKWSEHVAPIAGTKSCQAKHIGYVLSGRMTIVMEDGTRADIGPGDFFQAEPGHDAWVVGDEPCVLVDFGGYAQYARSATTAGAQRTSQPQSGPSRR